MTDWLQIAGETETKCVIFYDDQNIIFFFSHETSQNTNKIVTETTRLMKKVAGLRGLDKVNLLALMTWASI